MRTALACFGCAWLGCIVGVFVAALCQAAGRADESTARQAQRLTGGEVKQ